MDELDKKQEELKKLRFSLQEGQLKDISRINKTKKEIARILTKQNVQRRSSK